MSDFHFIVVEDETDRVDMMQAEPFESWQVAPERPGFTQYEPAAFEFTPGASQTLRYDRGRNAVVNNIDEIKAEARAKILHVYRARAAAQAAQDELGISYETEIADRDAELTQLLSDFEAL